jgi:hypothetical protein
MGSRRQTYPAVSIGGDFTAPVYETIALGRSYRGAPRELETWEIVAELRREIAAKSPEHAALVAEYERLQELPPEQIPSHQGTNRNARISEYAELRDDGASRAEACEAMGIGDTTARSYDAALCRLNGGDAA